MPRLAGVDIPADKHIIVSLTYIYGIGKKTAAKVLKTVGIDESMRAGKLAEGELAKLREAIESSGIKVEGDLRRIVQGNIKRLKDLQTYRGLRHIRKLPARGQRTKTNARTAKGRKRVPIAGKKIAPGPK